MRLELCVAFQHRQEPYMRPSDSASLSESGRCRRRMASALNAAVSLGLNHLHHSLLCIVLGHQSGRDYYGTLPEDF